MKKARRITVLHRFSAILLLAAIIAVTLSGCGTPAAIKYRDTVITPNVYQFYFSRYKAQILSSYNSGQDNLAFWNKEIEEGVTYADFFEDLIRDNMKVNAICLQLFSDYGLKLADDVYAEIDSDIASLIEEYGSRSEFNLAASQYGVNDRILRDVYVMDKKTKALYSYLYGEGGVEAITDEERESYYREKYAHIKTIFINTTYIFVADEDGNYVYDDEGYAETIDMTEEQKAEAEAKAAELKARLEAGEDFEDLIEEYTDDPANLTYKDGFYFSKDSGYYGDVIDVGFGLEEGEWGVASSEYGTHFVLRLPLGDKAYEDEDKVEFFSDMDDLIVNEKFDATVKSLSPSVEENEEICGQFSIIDIPQNLDM